MITRWEPSVVRAEMMAMVALLASFQGRQVSKWFCLSAGSTIALLVDPFLVGSAGFLLSVSACAGMAGLGEFFFSRLRGPFWLRRAIAYSVAAQLGVAPVQVAIFDQLPVVGLLTNVAAEPLAGLVMVWGVVGGLMAGIVPFDSIRALIHVPDTFALWIVRLIAHSRRSFGSAVVGKVHCLCFELPGSGGTRSNDARRALVWRVMTEAVQAVYLIKGDDPALLSEELSGLIERLVGERSADLTVQDIPEDAEPGAVIDACQTPAFLTDRRVVVVRGAGRFRADEVEPLIAYLTSPMPTTCLVLVGGGGTIPTRLQKAVKEHGHVIDASVPAGKGRQVWLTSKLKESALRLDRQATAVLQDRLGNELGQLTGVLDALASAYGETAVIDVDALEPFLGAGGAAAPWELTDAIDSGDTVSGFKAVATHA